MFRPVREIMDGTFSFFNGTGQYPRYCTRPNSLKFFDKDLTNNIDMGIIDCIVI